ncbi:galactose mutarotase [Lichenihabitans sp. Uapishka_5]|uniref:aldose epimerase family protein n=1 Tax=Lichenihabitans sp. Uapishka_5 TaxID=3037302 RepID=UPI0029E7EAC7|nr:aldose epimerase family protein [Lichenihabitans sp. Uapishka_5]MDX7950920.1 galactose mutarotase [Lichenihabitans sp. Uapishka_5]
MSGAVRDFGEVDGIPVQEISIASAAGLEASIITWGAVIRDLAVPVRGVRQSTVLGLNSLADYRAHSPSFGAVPGRYANRIARGQFAIDGRSFQVPCNEKGRNALHGGTAGFNKLPWRLANSTADSVTLALHSADGDMGFPGNLDVTCLYRLDGLTLRMEITATTDAPTVVNLTNHAYFNLDGSADVRDHELSVAAAFRTAVDDELIPTGAIVPVAGTPFDFRAPRPIRDPSDQHYDMNYVLARQPDAATGLAHAALLRSKANGLALEVATDQFGVQIYDGAKVHVPVAGLDGAHYGAYAGVAMETQNFPDAPNHRHFPSSVLRPGETYRQITEYRFSL